MSKASATTVAECDSCGSDEFNIWIDPDTNDMRVTCADCRIDQDFTGWKMT